MAQAKQQGKGLQPICLVVKLSWPDKRLSPNARLHWGDVAKAKRIAKHEAWAETMRAKNGKLEPPLYVRVTYHPPDNRRRDDDNIIASLKASRDGIAAALGIDDSHFKPVYNDGEVVDGGCVVWQIQEAEK